MLFRAFYLSTLLVLLHCSLTLATEPIAPSWREWTRPDGTEFRGMLMNVTETEVIVVLEDASQCVLEKKSLVGKDRELAASFEHMISEVKNPIHRRQTAKGEELKHGEVPAQLPFVPAMTFEALFRNGVPHGLAQYRAASNRLCQVEPHLNGQLHGTKIQLYPTGELYTLTFMDHGVPVGLHPRFFPKGNVALLVEWQNGEPHGLQVSYHLNGKKKDVYPLEHGKKHGTSTHYTASGDRYAIQKWHQGTRVDVVVLREIDSQEHAEIAASNLKEFGEIWDAFAR